jgi:SPP1 gp7 family putative phage head morphogenesis protein
MLVPKQVTHGESQIDYGSGEKPRYAELRLSINQFYRDILRPLNKLDAALFAALGFERIGKEDAPFRYTVATRRVVNQFIDTFLEEMAGPERSRAGFVAGGIESDTADGVLQARSVLSYSVGIARAADLVGAQSTLVSGRQTPAVQQMLDNAFTRLSVGGALRLEGVRDEIHGILVSATDAGLSPLDTARQLSGQFDQYEGWEWQRLARTEAAFAAEAGTRDQFQEFGVEAVTILISDGACPICESFDGQVIALDETDSLPPYHVNCLCSTAPAGPIAGLL